MASEQSKGSHRKKLLTRLADYRYIRHQRYAAVNVLLISWKDDDTNSATEIKQLKTFFQESFHYTACSYQIPSTDSQASLNFQIASFLHAFGGPDNLLIIYYGGHGGPRIGNNRSPCTWAALVSLWLLSCMRTQTNTNLRSSLTEKSKLTGRAWIGP